MIDCSICCLQNHQTDERQIFSAFRNEFRVTDVSDMKFSLKHDKTADRNAVSSLFISF